MKFTDLSLSEPVMRAITELGFETPSPIQIQALPLLLEGKTDFMGLAATGTGKTAAFSIPMIEQLDTSVKAVQTLILCPTRELALQVSEQVKLLGKYKGAKTVAIYGGAPYYEQIQGLKHGANVVVGTPGRVIDHIEKGTLKLDQVKQVILDEADEMISMGFKDDLEKILSASFSDPRDESKGQIWLFSATMSPEIRRVADKYLVKPKLVQVNKTEMLSSTVTQLFYHTREANKPEILCKVIDMAENFYGIIFCQTKALVADLNHYLTDRGYKVDCLHGDKDQNARERTMKAFRERKVKILVCTDVASRGLDVKDITHVINYSIPRELDSYVHRIGRTGRAGAQGYAMSLVTPAQMGLLRRVEKMTRSRIEEGVIPTRKEVGTKKVTNMLPRFQEEQFFTKAIDLLDGSWLEVIKDMSKEEITARFVALMNPGLFSESNRAQMPGPKPRDEGSSQGRDRGGRSSERRSYGRDGGGRREDRGENRGERSFERPRRFDNRDDRRSSEGGERTEKRAFRRDFNRDENQSGENRTERRNREFNTEDRRERSSGDERRARGGGFKPFMRKEESSSGAKTERKSDRFGGARFREYND